MKNILMIVVIALMNSQAFAGVELGTCSTPKITSTIVHQADGKVVLHLTEASPDFDGVLNTIIKDLNGGVMSCIDFDYVTSMDIEITPDVLGESKPGESPAFVCTGAFQIVIQKPGGFQKIIQGTEAQLNIQEFPEGHYGARRTILDLALTGKGHTGAPSQAQKQLIFDTDDCH